MNSTQLAEKHGVRRSGCPGEPQVVLLHSLAANSGMWWPQVEVWADEFEVITYDLRGHGRGPRPESGRPGMGGLIDDLQEVIDVVGGGPVMLVGLSLGGMIAQRYAAISPGSVAKLVLADTDFYTPPGNVWTQRIELMRRHGIESIVETTIERWFTQDFIDSRSKDCDRVRQSIRENSVAGYAHCAEIISTLDNRDFLPGIKSPTLVVVGAEDPSTPPKRARALANRIPDATYRSIENARHLPNIERSAEFNKVVRAFLLDR